MVSVSITFIKCPVKQETEFLERNSVSFVLRCLACLGIEIYLPKEPARTGLEGGTSGRLEDSYARLPQWIISLNRVVDLSFFY